MGNTLNAYGKPVISDTFTPVADMQAIADFANDFANVRVGTSAARQALPVGKQRAGMLWVETDSVGSSTPRIMRTDGAGNWTNAMGGTVIPLTSFSANWSATSGYSPVLVVNGEWREIYGAATRGAGGALTSILQIPAGHYSGSAVFLGAGVTSGGVAYELNINPSGVLNIPYGGGSATGAYPLTGRWRV